MRKTNISVMIASGVAKIKAGNARGARYHVGVSVSKIIFFCAPFAWVRPP
jgi:hypothetical protein